MSEPITPPTTAERSPTTTLTSRARRRARATPAWIKNLRYAFSPENLREFVTTLALVVPLTVLIWVWAEREQTAEYKPILTLGVHALNPSRSMSIVDATGDGRPVNVGVTLVGPKSGVDALRDAINRDASHARITLEVPDDVDPTGTRDVNIQPLLDEQKLFREYGVTVKSAEPNTLKIRSDDLVTRDLTVSVPAEFTGRVESFVGEPMTVRVRGPEALIVKLAASGTLRADLDVASLVARHDAEPGATIPPGSVALRPIAGVTFEPAQVGDVRLQFSQAEQGELRSIVVYVAQPARLRARVTVDPPLLTSVKIAGPPDVVRQLQSKEGDARSFYAQLRIDRADLGQSGTRPTTIVGLPAGVRVVDEASIPPVRFDVAPAADGVDGTGGQ